MYVVVSQARSMYWTGSLLFLFAFWFVAGCSSIPQNVTLVIESTPSGATVSSNQGWECITPCTRSALRGSRVELELVQSGYQSVEQSVEIPELKPSRVGTYIGASAGVVAGLGAIELGEALGTVLFDVFLDGLFGSFELSTSEKLEVVAQGALIFGGVGYVIDRMRDGERAKQPHRVNVSMIEHEADEESTRSKTSR